MTEERPEISFPCEDYPIKVIGIKAEGFSEFVLTVVERHAPGFAAERIEVRESNGGNYISMTLWITATGHDQLSGLNAELRKNSMIKMVL